MHITVFISIKCKLFEGTIIYRGNPDLFCLLEGLERKTRMLVSLQVLNILERVLGAEALLGRHGN